MSSPHPRADQLFFIVSLSLMSVSFSACDERRAQRVQLGAHQLGLGAYCDALVEGSGEVDIERFYLPRVVACENGAASFEALKAQAVAARSYLYYKLDTSGVIADSQADQVFSCNRPPGPQHEQAVQETSGQVLRYMNTQVAAFYVAGAIPTADSCVALPSDRDDFNTERFVTYNQGRSGDELIQTPLGWVNPGNYANRGCKSQNGADCLSEQGWRYDEILRFYYGEDIELITAIGPCVSEPPLGGAMGGQMIAGEMSAGEMIGGMSGVEPTTSGVEPTTSGAEPTTSGAEPTTSGAEPTTSGAEPTTSGVEPTTSGVEPELQAGTSLITPTDEPPSSTEGSLEGEAQATGPACHQAPLGAPLSRSPNLLGLLLALYALAQAVSFKRRAR